MKETDTDGSSGPEDNLGGDNDELSASSHGNRIVGNTLAQGNHNLTCDIAPDDSNQSVDDDAEHTVVRIKRRIQAFSDSDEEPVADVADSAQTEVGNRTENTHQTSPNQTISQTGNDGHKNILHKSRLCLMSTSGEESNSDSKSNVSSENEMQSRIKSKRNKLRDKFKRLHAKKVKPNNKTELENNLVEKQSDESDKSNDEDSSIENIKKIIKERPFQLKCSLYDPDTSDEEPRAPSKEVPIKKGRKSTKPTSPKPLRMSAKQAMENMQKIKSESNRMLREKDVSLPYHRPKALTLKDIMNRRRAAVTTDGKALPIKMNDEQLKQYAQILEQRQKEVIELCKSDTEEEVEEELEKTEINTDEPSEVASQNDTLYDDLSKTEELLNASTNLIQLNPEMIVLDLGTINEKKSHEPKLLNEVSCTETNITEQNGKESYSNIDNFVNPKLQEDHESKDVDENHCNNETVLNAEANITTHNGDESYFKTDNPINSKLQKDHEGNAISENNSMEMELVYNDSVEEDIVSKSNDGIIETTNDTESADKTIKLYSEVESQLISLHYNNTENNTERIDKVSKNDDSEKLNADKKKSEINMSMEDIQKNDFSDDDMNMEDIDALIEKADIAAIQGQTHAGIVDSPMLIKDPLPLSATPKLTGAPGMVIDLDGTDPLVPKKMSGVELLKERFVFFAKLKTPEELEREREKRIKPGMQHLKLKRELEEQIAEQRSLEWAKRLDDEKQHHKELNALRGEDSEADEDDIDVIDKKLEEKEEVLNEHNSSGSEEEDEESEQEIVDKPRKRNPMVDDEAEESDCDEEHMKNHENDAEEIEGDDETNLVADPGNDADGSEEESSDETEESEDEEQNKPKKGRILKAFEDSDDEDTPNLVEKDTEKSCNIIKKSDSVENQLISNTQDDEQLHLAQKSMSEDFFTSQESSVANSGKNNIINNERNKSLDDKELGTQTFSLLETTSQKDADFLMPDSLTNPPDTQIYGDSLDAVVVMCSGSFSQTQNLIPTTQTTAEVPVSQVIGDDVLALCTGQFYDNQFISQPDIENKQTTDETISDNLNGNESPKNNDRNDNTTENVMELALIDETEKNKCSNSDKNATEGPNKNMEKKEIKKAEDPSLKSILEELNDPEFDSPKPNKYFVGNNDQDKENKQSIVNVQFKKKFTIDSDEEEATAENTNVKKRKKIKRKKLEQRALQISDDEDEEEEETVEYESDLEDRDAEEIVEYDSDENEVVVQADNPKKKRRLGEFFEQEAELTSEDEWAGSGDEDEAGLDRLEREAGDDDTFDQKQLQRELGQIHMRDVLDQDKREVRLIQELLFEDADLGSGSRQRKFRWRNADGEEVLDTGYGEFADTQEEEFESEELWRKQRHEREVFLRTLKNQEEPEESLNISMNRTTIIKANLSKNSCNLFLDPNASIEELEPPASEKKTTTARDIPSPQKPFTIFQQNYHGSLLTRGRGALARLAALATPLANDDDAPKGSLKPTSKRNFVFTSIDAPTDDPGETKVTKRKAENNAGTPRLVKKMRTEDKHKQPKTSLLDHMKV